MAAIFAFTCTSCGKMHEGSPSFAFDAPLQYTSLTEEQQKSMAKLSSDLCTITDDEGTDYFSWPPAPSPSPPRPSLTSIESP